MGGCSSIRSCLTCLVQGSHPAQQTGDLPHEMTPGSQGTQREAACHGGDMGCCRHGVKGRARGSLKSLCGETMVLCETPPGPPSPS